MVLISIEGNIGSGKSTLLKIIREKYKDNENIIFVDEPVSEWLNIKDSNQNNILELFYKDKKKYSFSFQILAYITRLRKILEAIENNKDKIIICERSIYSDKFVFAKMLYEQKFIDEIDWINYNYWFDTFKNKTKLYFM
jgi:deoxyadenosine/deoxycytidine kinase